MIGVLAKEYGGDAWSRAVPYEFTHAFLRWGEHRMDAKGLRSLDAMADDFGIAGNFQMIGPWRPDDFRKRFMGNSDSRPLYGGAAEIKEAETLIRAHIGFYVFP